MLNPVTIGSCSTEPHGAASLVILVVWSRLDQCHGGSARQLVLVCALSKHIIILIYRDHSYASQRLVLFVDKSDNPRTVFSHGSKAKTFD